MASLFGIDLPKNLTTIEFIIVVIIFGAVGAVIALIFYEQDKIQNKKRLREIDQKIEIFEGKIFLTPEEKEKEKQQLKKELSNIKVGIIDKKAAEEAGNKIFFLFNDLKTFKLFEFQDWIINKLGAKYNKTKVGKFYLDGYFEKSWWHRKIGIQVKQNDNVGRNEINNFEIALRKADYKRGLIVAFNFSKDAYEGVARAKKEGLDIKLIKVLELL